jgi:hypothetical protein
MKSKRIIVEQEGVEVPVDFGKTIFAPRITRLLEDFNQAASY